MKKEWKEIELYNKKYKVSNYGEIFSCKIKKNLKPYYSSGGYLYVTIRDNNTNISHHIKIHRLVAKLFLDNPNDYPCVNHIDGDKENNRVDNLEYCTYSYNMNHAISNDLIHIKGTKTKIDQYDLNGKFIKRWNSMADIERKYKVSHTAIRFCCLDLIKTCKGYKWKYVED